MSPRTDLIPAAEIARMAGVSRQRAHVIAALDGFPTPTVASSLGKLWRREDVEKWLASWQRRPGRPRMAEADLSKRGREKRRYAERKAQAQTSQSA
jgi:hypothetical protein